MAQSLLEKGFQVTGYAKNGIPDIDLACILEYYAFDAGRYCTETARLVYRAFAAIGIRQWIRDTVGFRTDYEATNPYVHILVGTWKEERELGIPVRKEFNSFLKQIGKPYYDRYTNLCYSALFGCSAATLRQLRTTEGTSKIARNHLPQSLELRAIQMLEEAIVRDWEETMSLTRLIVWHGNIIKAQMHLPHFGKSKSRSKVWKEMCADDRKEVTSLVGNDVNSNFVLPEGF